jgi:glycosyltransferase involved in cell wall biosynthesis
MANFNSSKFISQTIESVISQTYINWEFIIIDDCSTDNSREIIDSYHDDRIKKIYLDHHEHMVYGFNLGISHSTGDYLARIDNDDTWEPEKLEKQIIYMEANRDCGACFTLVNVIDEFRRILTEKDTDRVRIFNTGNRNQTDWLRYFYFNGSCLCHTTVMIKREIINSVGLYNYSLVQLQDFDLWVRIAKKYPIYVIQERLVNYRWLVRSNGNASAPSLYVSRRSNYEFHYIISRYFDDIPDELFIESFGGDFIRKGTTDHDELLCERAFLLLKTDYCGNLSKLGGLSRFIDLLQNDRTREILKDKYGFTQMDFYELSATPIFYEGNAISSLSIKEIFLALVKKIFSKNRKIYYYLTRIRRLMKN